MHFVSTLLIALFLIFCQPLLAEKDPAELGYRHFRLNLGKDTVDVLVASAEGAANDPKPLFLFCQGSLPIPLIVYDDQGTAGIFPFDERRLTQDYHLVIISKPGIPISAHTRTLRPDFTYAEADGHFPKYYLEHNYLDYYVERNNQIIAQLQKYPWVAKNQLVVAGHSEGATIAAKMALKNKRISHVIFASGNPLGRILSMIASSRKSESPASERAESDFHYWEYLLEQDKNKDSIDYYARTDYSFSLPPMEYLKKLRIPVLVSYGSVDNNAPYNDYLRIWCIQHQKKNFQFNCYVGLEHNYFGTDANGKTDYGAFHWDDVATDWMAWIKQNR